MDVPGETDRIGDRTKLPDEEAIVGQGQWGPRGPQAAPSVHPVPLRTLFHSGWAIWMARAGLVLSLTLITFLSLAPAPDMMSGSHIDKLMHLLAYGGVAGLAVLSRWMGWGWAILFATVWGVGVEGLQGLGSAGRHASVADMAANALGAGIGALAARGLLRL